MSLGAFGVVSAVVCESMGFVLKSSRGRLIASMVCAFRRWTTRPAVLFALFVSVTGCARPLEERTAREKRINAFHRTKLNTAKEEKNDPYWLQAREEVYRTPEELLAQDARERGQDEPLAKLVRGTHREKSLLLTFDDGPHAASTLPLLKILAEEHVPATFFVIGKMVERRPDLLRAIARAGHTIGNHTFSHVTLPRLPEEEIRTEYRANNEIVRKVVGQTMRFCRPPGGDYDAATIRAAQAEGLTTVLWTDDPGDFANPGDGIVLDRTLKRLSNGGVILLHDGSPNTIDVLRELIHEARARGFEFTTPQAMVEGVGDLRRRPGVAMKGSPPSPLSSPGGSGAVSGSL